MIVKSLIDGDGYDDEENISENGIEEGYLFLLNSNKIFFLVAKWAIHNCHGSLKDFNFLNKYVVSFSSPYL